MTKNSHLIRKPVRLCLHLGADRRSEDATGLRLAGSESPTSCSHCILHG